jgi:hypothetical protein
MRTARPLHHSGDTFISDQQRCPLLAAGSTAPAFVRFLTTDGVIGWPAFRSLEILGAALQADGEYEVRGNGLKHQKEKREPWSILLD